MKAHNWIYLSLATVVLIGLVAAQSFFNKQTATAGSTMTATATNDFTLTQNHQAVHLHDFRGKLVLLYFGYASCPDVCPTSLALLSSALKELSAEEAAQIQPIFISVDPERDNGTKLMDYARYFFPSFIGITGTEQEIQRTAMQYGAFYSKVKSTSAMGYTVDHSSNSYLLGKDGQLLTTFKHDVNKAEIIAGIRAALKN
ncbi:SCO family protein [uncultured Thiothrix sp.]|uniref:SCO family protein n=1 Tax=uncultured Thiothrix sp. TaxID=223185 RepID=UPI002628D584|nr:SCO family protein [uncultured Thiothrix sp.]HMT92641.1 SCO family protein [Thiolinea sp.]